MAELVRIYRGTVGAGSYGVIEYSQGNEALNISGVLVSPGTRLSLCLNNNKDLILEQVDESAASTSGPNSKMINFVATSRGMITGTVKNLTGSSKTLSVYLKVN